VSYRSVVASLWLRLISVAIVASVFAEALHLASGAAQGWSYYLTFPEVAFEIAVRLVFVALAALALGTVCTAALAPFLWTFSSSRERLSEAAIKVAVGAAVFLDGWLAVSILLGWFKLAGPAAGIIYAAYFLAFALVLCVPRGRKEVVTSLDGLLGEKATRRVAITTGIGAVALVATEFALGKTAPAAVRAATVTQRPKPNIVLITFDALSAEDMSLYGYKRPTTPNIDAFARQSTVFTNFYSASTFTTPSVATILTGLHPSENLVYHLPGRLKNANAGRSLPHLMRTAGYATGASVSNPYAYYLAESLANEYDSLPAPPYRRGALKDLWDATEPLHQRSPAGSRAQEFADLESAWDCVPDLLESWSQRHFGRMQSGYPAAGSFEQAREVLAKLPEGFFLWVHVMAPHLPYLPDATDRGRFLASDEMSSAQEQDPLKWWPRYTPDQQSRVDKARLRYDEFVASADRAFGAFISGLESGGRLRDTAVIVSADHGESFEGGVYTHLSPYQTRPVIHVPFIVRTPNQHEGRRVGVTADQTAVAPTILDLAGQPKPEWMPGRSLVGWLNRDGEGEGEGMAFTEYFGNSDVFKPLRSGTVGVIDGQYQYVLDLGTGKGVLRPINEAQVWDVDRSAEQPAEVEKLRAAIYARFPHVPKVPVRDGSVL